MTLSCRLAGVAVKDSQMPEVASWVHVRSKTPILIVYLRVSSKHRTTMLICVCQEQLYRLHSNQCCLIILFRTTDSRVTPLYLHLHFVVAS